MWQVDAIFAVASKEAQVISDIQKAVLLAVTLQELSLFG